MAIFAGYMESEAARLSKEGVRLRFIGERARLEKKLQKLMILLLIDPGIG